MVESNQQIQYNESDLYQQVEQDRLIIRIY